MVEMHVSKVVQLQGENQCLVVLADGGGQRVLPIGVGPFEATAIAIGAGGIATPRPMTHDLVAAVIQRLQGAVERVVIHDMREHTFIGQIEIRTENGVVEIDCRPSDGMAVALRTGSPIFVAEEVLTRAAVDPDSLKEQEEQDQGSGEPPAGEPRSWD